MQAGQEFAGYTIVGLLGSGGMGEVYLARHPRLPRNDALKVLRSEISADDTFRLRFIREADSVAALEHPNIVTVYDRGDTDGQLWIANQYVDGTDAAALLTRYPAGLPVDEVTQIVTAVAAALDHAHDAGLLHRDVKPANILLAKPDRNGERRIYLADFGIARPLDDPSGLTSTNFALGTFAFAAPEQLMGADLDGRADQYALAATTYNLLTGAALFPDSNPIAVISRHLTEPPPAPSQIDPKLAPFDAAFARALSKDPQDRYPHSQDFARDIAAAAATAGTSSPTAATQQAPTAAPPDPTSGQRRAAPDAAQRRPRRWVPLTAALMAIAAIATIVLVWKFTRPETPTASSGTSTANPDPPPSNAAPRSSATVPTPVSPAPLRPVFAARPIRLPLTLGSPAGMAVDASGNLYIADKGDVWTGAGGVLKLTPGESQPSTLPFSGATAPCGVTIDPKGTVFVIEPCANAYGSVLKLPAGASNSVELAVTLQAGAKSIAADPAGNLFLVTSSRFGAYLEKLAPGASATQEIPTPGVSPYSVAVDPAGNVYVAGHPGKVIKLPAGSSQPVELPFPGIDEGLVSVAVDAAGTVYVLHKTFDDPYHPVGRVLALPTGSQSATELPFGDVPGNPEGITAGAAGVYVSYTTPDGSAQSGYVLLLRRSE